MYSLIIDSGNSTVKLSLVDGDGKIAVEERFPILEVAILQAIFDRYSIDRAIYCAVRELEDDVVGFLRQECRFVLEFNSKTAISLENGYKTPNSLGVDRMAAAVGACDKFEGCNILIIDFGSAITVDFVEEGKVFRGGNISPGTSLRFKSLNSFTKKLPLCTLSEQNFEICATSTQSAIQSGVVAGILYETEGYINYYSKNYSNLKIIFTGGDAKYFGDKLKIPIFVSCEIVTRGLYKILNENDKG